MGVNIISNKMIMDAALAMLLKQEGTLSMVLLGDQFMRPKVRDKFREAQKHYAAINHIFGEVIAVDNKEREDDDYLFQCDLGVEQKSLFNKFDILFNGGTAEHVVNQKQVWRNAHYFLKEGGIAIHVCPLMGGWKEHSEYLYDPEFFGELIKANSYEVIGVSKIIEHKMGKAIYLSFRKVKTGAFQWKPCEPYIKG